MPRNGSGNYTLPAGNPVVSNTLITSSWANNTLNDIAAEITNSLARNGAGGMTAPLRLTDGTVSAPSLSFNSETTTGLYRIAAGQIGLSTLGVLRFDISAAGATFAVPVTVNGNLTVSGTISGSGASLTNINASNITSGTLADARLSSNVPLKNVTNTFTANQIIDNGATTSLHLNSTTNSEVRFNATGQPANNRLWILLNVGSSLQLRAYDDTVSSSNVAINFHRTGITPGQINTYGTLYVGAEQSNNGYMGIVVGGASASGSTQFFSPTGVRVGFIGAATTYGTGDNGTLPYIAGTHAFTGDVTVSGVITGNGSGLTSLNASNISSGTIADARLSSNVALKNAANTFTANQTVSAGSSSVVTINSSGSPQLRFENTAAAANERNWIVYADTASFQIRPYNDSYSSNTAALSIFRSGFTAGAVYTYGNLYVGASQPSVGYMGLLTGGGSSSGYTGFYSPSGTRVGFIGAATTYGTGDNGTLPYVAGVHAFTGAMTVSDDLAPGRLISYTKYTNGASGNYGTPANARLLVVQMVGGGGGGGPGGPYAGGGGGGSGAASLIVIRNPSGNYAYSAGTGGGSGSTGTASSFAGLQSGGGQGGGNNGHPGAAGSNGGSFSGAGTLVLFESLTSSSGGSGAARYDGAGVAGEGGPSCFSFGGQPGTPGVNSNGNPGGAGGGGGGGVGSGSGGAGGYGEIRVFAYA
jgi:hypothetical protein